MKKVISKLVLVSFSMFLLLSVSAFKGDSNRNSKQNNGNAGSCLSKISGLTGEQKTAIAELETQHQNFIDALKEKRRATTDVAKKATIRTQMLDSKAAHQLAVKALLNEKQKAEFDLLQNQNQVRNQNAGNTGKGKKLKSGNKGNGNGVKKKDGSGKCNGNCSGNKPCKKQ